MEKGIQLKNKSKKEREIKIRAAYLIDEQRTALARHDKKREEQKERQVALSHVRL